jgi:hypothetical protein
LPFQIKHCGNVTVAQRQLFRACGYLRLTGLWRQQGVRIVAKRRGAGGTRSCASPQASTQDLTLKTPFNAVRVLNKFAHE